MIKSCPLCGEQYPPGAGGNSKHRKERHPELVKANLEKMNAARSAKHAPPPPPPPRPPATPQAVVPETAVKQAQIALPQMEVELQEDEREEDGDDIVGGEGSVQDLVDYLTSTEPPGNGNGKGNHQEVPGKPGGVVPKTARTTIIPGEATGISLVPKVVTYSSVIPYLMFNLMVNEYGWDANMPMPNFLDTVLVVAAASWGFDIQRPYSRIGQEG
jgi:hypothetical protein